MTDEGPIDGTAADTGEPDAGLTRALASGDAVGIRAAFLTARVMVPIVALGDESRSAEMVVPRLVGADGRHALPVFSSYDALRAWRADARPVPMPGTQAVAAALGESYAALVLDVAGPVTHVIELRAATL